jgi:hypothetical protein
MSKAHLAEAFEGYTSPLAAAAGHNARAHAMLSAIQHIALLLEECHTQGEVYPLATALQACVESAQIANEIVDHAVTTMQAKDSQ